MNFVQLSSMDPFTVFSSLYFQYTLTINTTSYNLINMRDCTLSQLSVKINMGHIVQLCKHVLCLLTVTVGLRVHSRVFNRTALPAIYPCCEIENALRNDIFQTVRHRTRTRTLELDLTYTRDGVLVY